MMRGLAGLVATLGCAGASLACSGDAPDTSLDLREQPIIRGTIVQSDELNHTGALVAILPGTGERAEFCTGTLIGAETVVTAKHCVLSMQEAERFGYPLAWLAGPS